MFRTTERCFDMPVVVVSSAADFGGRPKQLIQSQERRRHVQLNIFRTQGNSSGSAETEMTPSSPSVPRIIGSDVESGGAIRLQEP